MEGYVKLYRQILKSSIFKKKAEFLKIFIYIFTKVNHSDGIFEKGSNFFNFEDEYRQIPHVTKNQIYEFLRWAKSEKEQIITTQKTTRGVIIKFNNWERFQGSEKDELQDTLQDSYKTATRQLQNNYNTINKNDKNVKNDKNERNILKGKFDPFINSYKDTFVKEYENVFGVKPFLLASECNKLIQLAGDIENLNEHIPIAISKLKNINFPDINFKPSANWLLKESNFTRVLNGEFDAQESDEDLFKELRAREQAELERRNNANKE